MIIRSFRAEDSAPLLHLFFNTIRTVNLRDYTQEQVEAWAPDLSRFDLDTWNNSFQSKFVFVAEDQEELAGFGELEPDGHIDRFYISHKFIGQGVGKSIFEKLEKKARELELKRLFVEASVTAKPFFEKSGFTLIRSQEVERNNVKLRNFVMEKLLK